MGEPMTAPDPSPLDLEAPPAQEQVRAVQGWMALDLHMALGHTVDHDASHQGRRSWADWWADLCGEVRALSAALAEAQRERDEARHQRDNYRKLWAAGVRDRAAEPRDPEKDAAESALWKTFQRMVQRAEGERDAARAEVEWMRQERDKAREVVEVACSLVADWKAPRVTNGHALMIAVETYESQEGTE